MARALGDDWAPLTLPPRQIQTRTVVFSRRMGFIEYFFTPPPA